MDNFPSIEHANPSSGICHYISQSLLAASQPGRKIKRGKQSENWRPKPSSITTILNKGIWCHSCLPMLYYFIFCQIHLIPNKKIGEIW